VQGSPFAPRAEAYVTNSRDGTITVVDLTASTAVSTMPVGGAPYGVGLGPEGTRAVFVNGPAGALSTVDLAAWTTTATLALDGIPVGFGPFLGAATDQCGAAAVTSCDDHDPFTADQGCASPRGCGHTARTGADAVQSGLAALKTIVASAQVSGRTQTRLRQEINGLTRQQAVLGSATTGLATGPVRRATKRIRKRLDAVATLVERARARQRLTGADALAIRDLALGTRARAEALLGKPAVVPAVRPRAAAVRAAVLPPPPARRAGE
jgi:YVTN family beta-propeller protein